MFTLKFAATARPYPGKVTESAGNPHWLIEWVESGRGELRIGGESYALAAGDVYLVPPNVPYGFTADRRDPWVKRYILVEGALASHLLADYGIAAVGIARVGPDGDGAGALFADFQQNPDPSGEETALRFHRLVALLASRLRSTDGRPFSGDHERVLSAFRAAGTKHPPSVSALAAAFALSPSQLTRRLRAATGKTPHRLVMEERFRLAAERVRYGQERFKSIAAALGFPDEYRFSAFFKKFAGVSPREYRRRFGGY